jgi:hypothetical protein
MEPFDIKIECFGGQNHRRQQLCFSKRELGHLFSLLHKKTKNKKNKVWYQNLFF